MKSTISVKAKSRAYEILVGRDLLKELPSLVEKLCDPATERRALVIGDTHTLSLVQQVEHFLRKAGFKTDKATLIAGESSKNLDTVRHLYVACAQAQLDRKSLIVTVGGGVVGDVGGFVAATYLRGLAYIQIPTTVVAQVDAAIGGKTGVDLKEGKNLVGAFHQPSLVVCDLGLLETLPKRQFTSGLAEIIKYGLINDQKLFEDLERVLQRETVVLDSEVIVRCVQIKAEVVSRDEYETLGYRAILNFGHTIGHAIETVTGYDQLLHGEAVSIGMVGAAMLSERRLGLPSSDVRKIHSLLSSVGLPVKLPRSIQTPAALEKLIKTMLLDKKSKGGRLQFVLLDKIGSARPGQTIEPEEVRAVLEKLC